MIDNNTWHLASCTIELLRIMEANKLVSPLDHKGIADDRPAQRAYQNAIVALARVGRDYPPKNPNIRYVPTLGMVAEDLNYVIAKEGGS